MNKTLLAILSAATLTIPFVSPAYSQTVAANGCAIEDFGGVPFDINGNPIPVPAPECEVVNDNSTSSESTNTNENTANGGNATNTNSNTANGGNATNTNENNSAGGNATNTNSSTATGTSSNSNNNGGNSQSVNINDTPEATVAPLPENGVPGQIGDVVIPLPSIRGGVFTTRDNDIFNNGSDRTTTGATVGFQIPLGTGQVVAAAEQIVARRAAASRFQLIQEATWMLQQGVLSADAHPDHWAALYGSSD